MFVVIFQEKQKGEGREEKQNQTPKVLTSTEHSKMVSSSKTTLQYMFLCLFTAFWAAFKSLSALVSRDSGFGSGLAPSSFASPSSLSSRSLPSGSWSSLLSSWAGWNPQFRGVKQTNKQSITWNKHCRAGISPRIHYPTLTCNPGPGAAAGVTKRMVLIFKALPSNFQVFI